MATSFKPLLNRVEEMILSGSGTLRTIPTGSFGMESYYQGKEPEKLAQDVLAIPQASVRIEYETVPAFQRISQYKMFEIALFVDLAYRLDSELLKNRRTDVESQIMSDASTIQSALEYPGNLRQTEAGADTGLVSGLLTMEAWDPQEIDYQAHLARVTLRFTGRVIFTQSI